MLSPGSRDDGLASISQTIRSLWPAPGRVCISFHDHLYIFSSNVPMPTGGLASDQALDMQPIHHPERLL